MDAATIARSYASALHEIGQRHDAADRFGDELERLAGMLQEEPRIREFIEAPTVDIEEKKRVLRSALGGFHPLLVNFVFVVLDKRRQRLLRDIAVVYRAIRDEAQGHVRAIVTLAREPDERLEEEIRSALSRSLGKVVLPQFEVDPRILGGVRVRYEDRVIDGTLRRRLLALRRAMLTADL